MEDDPGSREGRRPDRKRDKKGRGEKSQPRKAVDRHERTSKPPDGSARQRLIEMRAEGAITKEECYIQLERLKGDETAREPKTPSGSPSGSKSKAQSSNVKPKEDLLDSPKWSEITDTEADPKPNKRSPKKPFKGSSKGKQASQSPDSSRQTDWYSQYGESEGWYDYGYNYWNKGKKGKGRKGNKKGKKGESDKTGTPAASSSGPPKPKAKAKKESSPRVSAVGVSLFPLGQRGNQGI